MAQDIFWPIANQKYPWLTKEESTKIDNYSSASGLTWMKLLQYQSNLYKEYINYKSQKERDEDRTQAKNQLTYASMKTEDKKQSNNYQNQERLEDLVDTVKNKYNLSSLMSSNDVMNWLVQKAHDDWVSIDLLNKYLNDWDKTFLYEMWLEERPVAWTSVRDNIKQWAKNIWGGLLTSFSKDFAKAWVNATAWAMDKFWVDEDTIEKKKANAMSKLDKIYDIWQDENSIAYNVADIGWDLLQLATWEWEIKIWAKALAKSVPFLEKLAKLWKTTDDLVKEAPVIWKLLSFTTRKWTQWAADTILYNALNWEWTDLWEMWEWAAINTVLWWGWKLIPSKDRLQSAAKWLEIGWLINKNTLKNVNTNLQRAWEAAFRDIEAAWEWMLGREVKWSKKEIAKQLENHADVFSKAKQELLKLSWTREESEAATKVRDFLEKLYTKHELWNEETLAWLKAIKGKTDWSAQELENMLWKFDDATKLFKWDADLWAWADKEWLWNLRRKLKEQIEDIINKDWLWDMKKINNEIQTAATLREWVLWKLEWEMVKSKVPWWLTHAIAMAAEAIGVPTVMRDIANAIAKYTWMEKTNIEKLLKENWAFDDEFLKKVVPENKREAFKNAINDITGKTPKNTTTDLARTDQLKVRDNKPFKETTSKEKTKSNKWTKSRWLENLIRQFLLTQTEEMIDNK